jgi:hypothetical protein
MQIRGVLALLLFSLAGCSYYQDPSQLEGDIISPGNFKAGSGVIESVGVLRNAARFAAHPAASGASKRRDPHLYRLYLRMDAGGFQSVDVDNGTFFAGEAVELTNDGRVVRVTGTSLNKAISGAR